MPDKPHILRHQIIIITIEETRELLKGAARFEITVPKGTYRITDVQMGKN